MIETSPSKEFILAETTELRDALPKGIEWAWDSHHNALLAEFSVDHEQSFLLTLAQYYPHKWDKKSIKQAAPKLGHRAKKFADLRASQLLFSTDNSGEAEIMLAWWPWGHGATISARIFRGNQDEYVPKSGLFQKISASFKK